MEMGPYTRLKDYLASNDPRLLLATLFGCFFDLAQQTLADIMDGRQNLKSRLSETLLQGISNRRTTFRAHTDGANMLLERAKKLMPRGLPLLLLDLAPLSLAGMC